MTLANIAIFITQYDWNGYGDMESELGLLRLVILAPRIICMDGFLA